MSRPGSILSLLSTCNDRLVVHQPKGRRYTNQELDFFTLKYIQGGKAAYEFEHANCVSPDVRTCQRHLKKMSHGVIPDVLRIGDLLNYLETNELSKVVILSEDATRISGGVGYDVSRDEIYGLVPPMDEHGMPEKNFFVASSPEKVTKFMQEYSIGRNLYVIMAQPLTSGARAFCLMYTCSDNKFSTQDVLRRWAFTDNEFKKVGIEIAGRSSDGDSRLVQSMMQRMGLPCKDETPFGLRFVCSTSNNICCIQDPTHLVNKLRVRLMRVEKLLIIGNMVKL